MNNYDLETWARPSSYGGFNPVGDFIVIGQNRDSDCLTRSNYETVFDALKAKVKELKLGDPPGADWETDEANWVYDFRAGHWACGWVETILVRKDAPEELQKEVYEILAALADYPVFNDEHYFELEREEADQVWENCYDWRDRIDYIRKNHQQFDFTSLAEMLEVARGKYFNGYASELLY